MVKISDRFAEAAPAVELVGLDVVFAGVEFLGANCLVGTPESAGSFHWLLPAAANPHWKTFMPAVVGGVRGYQVPRGHSTMSIAWRDGR